MRRLRQALALVLTGLAGWTGLAAADDIRLGVGRPVSAVRESFFLAVPEGTSTLALARLSVAADPASLQIRFPDAVVAVEGWRVRHPVTGPLERRGDAAVWRPDAFSVAAPPLVDLYLRSPLAVTTRVELTYLTTGLAWSARYTVQVRGDLAREEEAVALDLSARVRLENRTGRPYADARVLLVGEDAPPEAARAPPAGFLMLDEHPLADLWQDPPPAVRPRFSYLLPDPVTWPADGVLDVRWLEAPRRPATRLYRLTEAESHQGAPGGARALNRWLVMSHGAAGEVTALPAGQAEVQMGGQRAGAVRNAWIPHTAAGGQLRVDLGPVVEVTGERKFRSRTGKVGDSYEETRSVEVVNQLGSAIQIEVEERPPTELEWELLRSTAPHQRAGRRLIFATRVEAGGRQEIRYTVRIREPAF
jgi:hypothetical protein